MHMREAHEAQQFRAEKLEELAVVAKAWVEAIDRCGPDNGPSLSEHDCAEQARALLKELDA